MAWNEWDTTPDGRISVNPLVGWSTLSFGNGAAAGLRVEFLVEAGSDAQAAKQLSLSPAQVRELIGALTALAERLDAEQAADRPPARPN